MTPHFALLNTNVTYFLHEYTIKYYISLGFAPEKMAMGIPTYGRCWTLDDPEQNGMLAPANKPSPGGNYTMVPGSLGFNEVILDSYRTTTIPY